MTHQQFEDIKTAETLSLLAKKGHRTSVSELDIEWYGSTLRILHPDLYWGEQADWACWNHEYPS